MNHDEVVVMRILLCCARVMCRVKVLKLVLLFLSLGSFLIPVHAGAEYFGSEFSNQQVDIGGYGNTWYYIIPDSVIFHRGSGQMVQRSYAVLDRVVSEINLLHGYKNINVSLVYVDDKMERSKQSFYSQQARSVALYLHRKGIASNFISSATVAVKRKPALQFWRDHVGDSAFIQIHTN